jgi:hypothetical protein
MMRVQVVAHTTAAMAVQVVPEQQDALAAEVTPELLQEVDQALVVVGSPTEVEVEVGAPTVPAVPHHGGGRDPQPVALAVNQHGGIAAALASQVAPTTGTQLWEDLHN